MARIEKPSWMNECSCAHLIQFSTSILSHHSRKKINTKRMREFHFILFHWRINFHTHFNNGRQCCRDSFLLLQSNEKTATENQTHARRIFIFIWMESRIDQRIPKCVCGENIEGKERAKKWEALAVIILLLHGCNYGPMASPIMYNIFWFMAK